MGEIRVHPLHVHVKWNSVFLLEEIPHSGRFPSPSNRLGAAMIRERSPHTELPAFQKGKALPPCKMFYLEAGTCPVYQITSCLH